MSAFTTGEVEKVSPSVDLKRSDSTTTSITSFGKSSDKATKTTESTDSTVSGSNTGESAGHFQQSDVFNAIAAKDKKETDTKPKEVFFRSVSFDEDNDDVSDVLRSENSTGCDDNGESDTVANDESLKSAKSVESSKSVKSAEPKKSVESSKTAKSMKSVKTVEVRQPIHNNTESLMQKVDEVNSHPIHFCALLFAACYRMIAGIIKRISFSKLIKKGVKVEAGEFEFVKTANYLTLTKYSGVSNTIEVPATVGKLPVKYLHPDFLYSSVNPFDNYKFRSMKSALKGLSTVALDENVDSSFLSDITEIVLPNTLVAIPDGVFAGCTRLTELVIPASVKSFSVASIKNSGIVDIYFDGEVPQSFDVNKFKGNVFVKEDLNESTI